MNGDVRQTAGGGANISSGPPVVSITSGQPFMEAPVHNSKQNLSNVSISTEKV